MGTVVALTTKETAFEIVETDFPISCNGQPAARFTLFPFYHFTFHRRDRSLRCWEPSLETWRSVFSFRAVMLVKAMADFGGLMAVSED